MDVTFAISTFNRPAQLTKLIQSIIQYYPHVPIIISDNGNQNTAFQQKHITTSLLNFDVGASACRNNAMRLSTTEYVLLLDDDFVFIDRTKVENMISVLDYDQSIGVVGGTLIESTPQAPEIAFDIVGTDIVQTKSSIRTTTSGIQYQPCDYVRLFAMVRKSVGETTRWDEDLKIGGEHFGFFYDMLHRGIWRAAVTKSVVIQHDIHTGDAEYKKYRARATEFAKIGMEKIKCQ